MILFTFSDEDLRLADGWRDLWRFSDFPKIMETLNQVFGDSEVYCPADLTEYFRSNGLKNVQRYDAGSFPDSGVGVTCSDDFIKLLHKKETDQVMVCKLIPHTISKQQFNGIRCQELIPAVGFITSGIFIKTYKDFKLIIHIWDNGQRRNSS